MPSLVFKMSMLAGRASQFFSFISPGKLPFKCSLLRTVLFSAFVFFTPVSTGPIPFLFTPPFSSYILLPNPGKLPAVNPHSSFCSCMQNDISMVLFSLTNFYKRSIYILLCLVMLTHHHYHHHRYCHFFVRITWSLRRSPLVY